MDKDPAVEPELDAFSRILPLPYRIAVILVLGESHTFPKPAMPIDLYISRRLGMGRQSSLPVCHQDREQTTAQSKANTLANRAPGCRSACEIPCSNFFYYSSPLSEDIQTGDCYYFAPGCFYPSFLGHHAWTAVSDPRLGYSPSVVPLPPRDLLPPAVSTPLKNRPVQISLDLETCQHWRNCRSK